MEQVEYLRKKSAEKGSLFHKHPDLDYMVNHLTPHQVIILFQIIKHNNMYLKPAINSKYKEPYPAGVNQRFQLL
jgi:hypothetical protein